LGNKKGGGKTEPAAASAKSRCGGKEQKYRPQSLVKPSEFKTEKEGREKAGPGSMKKT